MQSEQCVNLTYVVAPDDSAEVLGEFVRLATVVAGIVATMYPSATNGGSWLTADGCMRRSKWDEGRFVKRWQTEGPPLGVGVGWWGVELLPASARPDWDPEYDEGERHDLVAHMSAGPHGPARLIPPADSAGWWGLQAHIDGINDMLVPTRFRELLVERSQHWRDGRFGGRVGPGTVAPQSPYPYEPDDDPINPDDAVLSGWATFIPEARSQDFARVAAGVPAIETERLPRGSVATYRGTIQDQLRFGDNEILPTIFQRR